MYSISHRHLSPSQRETKQLHVPLEIKSINGEGRFAGYASVFHLVDNHQDMVIPGAFRETIKGRTHEIKLLWQHDSKTPIGVIREMFEDQTGLYIEGQLMLELEKAREAHALLQKRVLSGLSIGYSPVRYTQDPETGIRQLKQIHLWEVSLVTFPANEESRISVVKSQDEATQLIALDYALKRLERLFIH